VCSAPLNPCSGPGDQAGGASPRQTAALPSEDGIAFGYDTIADRFEQQRALPDGAAQSVRAAVLAAIGRLDRPRLLDLGAGSGRFGWPFVAAGDDYIGVDLSAGMLRVFAARNAVGKSSLLVQADGCALPFGDASFDAVLLIAVFGDLPDWRLLIDEARRVLRAGGPLIAGGTVTPEDGIDERMKQRLDALLDERLPGLGRRQRGSGRRQDAVAHLTEAASDTAELTAASWSVGRCARAFLDRHAGGARFSRLPLAAREDALRELADWAQTEFGTLDAVFPETHRFKMQLFTFAEG
jgi:ubiquinone/menaquinone biosynthesis C-methylase UbiE